MAAGTGILAAQDAVSFSSELRLVPLNVTVLDKSGHLVTDLAQSTFQITEDGKPQAIKVFKREDVPVSLALVIDNSGSMRPKREGVESAALALIKDSNSQDETFVVNFNDEAFLDADFTSNLADLEKGLARIDSRGGTAMRDAIRMSVDHLHDKAKKDKKVLVIITDGNDNASSVSLADVVREAQQDNVLVYAIGLLSEETKKDQSEAKRALKLLVESTGGQVFYPEKVSDVEPIAHLVARDIRNQYSIAYSPTNTALDGTYRRVGVKVAAKGRGELMVRTRPGYYATANRK